MNTSPRFDIDIVACAVSNRADTATAVRIGADGRSFVRAAHDCNDLRLGDLDNEATILLTQRYLARTA